MCIRDRSNTKPTFGRSTARTTASACPMLRTLERSKPTSSKMCIRDSRKISRSGISTFPPPAAPGVEGINSVPGFLWKPGAFVNQPFAESSLGRIRLSRMAMRRIEAEILCIKHVPLSFRSRTTRRPAKTVSRKFAKTDCISDLCFSLLIFSHSTA